MGDNGAQLLPALNWGDPVEGDGEFVLPVGTVTLLLGDVEASTRGWEASPESMIEAMAGLRDAVAEAVGRHGGVRPLEQGEGDSFVAAFGRASDAVRCALDLQAALAQSSIRVRMGVHAGEAHLGTDKTYVGPAVNRTARLRDAGHGGQVLVSRTVADLVADALPPGTHLADLGVHGLKDLSRPEHIFQLVRDDDTTTFPPLRTLDTRPNNLPIQRTPLFGRQVESGEVAALLGGNRMVTLTGAGGCGKTRLAVHVAAAMAEEEPDGAFFVDLAAVQDGDGVIDAAIAALGATGHGESALVSHLSRKGVLLVLDNCEHVVGGVAGLVDRLLSAAPSVRVVATSREPLGVPAEVVYRVPTLAVPPEAPPGLEGLVPFAAAELFLDRARRSRPDFAAGDEEAAAIAEICRRLDGVPLAIELAAARVRAMTPAEIAAGLETRFGLLTGGARTAMPRHQTLKASVDWSHDLLTEPERVVFRRLAVFTSDFDLDAARQVSGFDPIEPHQVVDLMGLLVEKSLVLADPDGPTTRFRMLETIRQYAADQLATEGEVEEARARHQGHFRALTRLPSRAEDVEPFFAVARRERAHVRAAFDYSLGAEDADAMAELAAGPGFFDIFFVAPDTWHRWVGEVVTRLDRVGLDARWTLGVVRTCASGPTPSPFWTCLLEVAATYDDLGRPDRAGAARLAAGPAAWWQEPADARPALVDAAVAAATSGGWFERFAALITAIDLGDFVFEGIDTEPYLAALMAGMDETMPTSWQLYSIPRAITLLAKGEYAEAGPFAEQAAALSPLGLPFVARVRTMAGDLERGEALADEGLAASIGVDEGFGTAMSRHTIAMLRALGGESAAAKAGYREAAAAFASAPVGAATALTVNAHLALVHIAEGELDEAQATLDEAGGDVPLAWMKVWVDAASAALAWARREPERAESLYHAALDTAAKWSRVDVVAVCLEGLASAAADQESHAEATRLLGAADALRHHTGFLVRLPPLDRWHAAAVAAVRDHLGVDRAEVAWTEGAALSWREAVAYAVRGRGERKRPSSGWASLTPTESQVVALVRDGASNAAIAEQLFMSVRTVGSHLTHIYAKLGLSSRAALVAAANQRP